MISNAYQAEALVKTDVSSSTYAIYYDFNGIKMWLSPNNSIEQPYTCVSHPFRRYTFTEAKLTEKILELTKNHPTNIWLYEVVE